MKLIRVENDSKESGFYQIWLWPFKSHYLAAAVICYAAVNQDEITKWQGKEGVGQWLIIQYSFGVG